MLSMGAGNLGVGDDPLVGPVCRLQRHGLRGAAFDAGAFRGGAVLPAAAARPVVGVAVSVVLICTTLLGRRTDIRTDFISLVDKVHKVGYTNV